MLIVDPCHWLTPEGDLPEGPPKLRANALKVARLIEYGGPLAPGESRETLIECSGRPNRKKCPGLLWVTKQPNDDIVAGCMVCRRDEVLIHNWDETPWAKGPMEPARHDDDDERTAAPTPPAIPPEEQYRRFKKPYPASLDQVRITRKADEAVIEYAEPNVYTTLIEFGPALAAMSDEEVLARHNEVLAQAAEEAASYHHVAVEIPPGRPQIVRRGSRDRFSPRGGVLRCAVDDGGPNDEAILHVDDQPLTMHEFGRLLTTWAGWGIRVLLVPDDELNENPEIEVREPEEGEG